MQGGDFFLEVWAVAPFTCRGCAQTSIRKKITPLIISANDLKTEQIEKIAQQFLPYFALIIS